MNPQRLQVSFQDSSDDGGSHVAVLDVVPDGDGGNPNANQHATSRGDESPSGPVSSWRSSGRCERNGGSGVANWVGNAILRGVDHFTGGDKHSSEPFPVRQVEATPRGSSYSTQLGSDWGYGVYHESDSTLASGSDGSLSSSALLRLEVQGQSRAENYRVNLLETVLQYLRTPEDLYINMILASLKTGTTQVTADVFHAAAGCPLLIKTFLDSGYADVDDPEVQGVLQDELNMVLSGDAYQNDILEADQVDYLRCLCNVNSLRIDRRQMVLMRYSGFEYIKILYDCPHLRMDLPVEKQCVCAIFRAVHIVNLVAHWLGVLVSLLFTACVIWSAVNWFNSDAHKNNGFWTVICYGAGYVVNLVTSMRAEQGKISQYENQLWPYPNNNLVIVPAIPVLQLMLVITALRYEFTPDRTRYFIIRYDLHNGIGVHLIGHAMCHAIPQVILQLFLYTERDTGGKSTLESVCFWLLLGSACASFFMALFAYAGMTAFSHSCNSAGFAVMFVDTYHDHMHRLERIKPSDIATRILQFFTVAMLIAAAVTLFIFLLNIYNCSGGAKGFLAAFFGVTMASIVGLVVVFVYVNFSRLFGLFCVPVLIFMIAYFPFTEGNSQGHLRDPVNKLCSLFVYHFSVWVIPLFATFGSVCMTFLVWLGMVVYELITGERIQQEAIDNHLDI